MVRHTHYIDKAGLALIRQLHLPPSWFVGCADALRGHSTTKVDDVTCPVCEMCLAYEAAYVLNGAPTCIACAGSGFAGRGEVCTFCEGRKICPPLDAPWTVMSTETDADYLVRLRHSGDHPCHYAKRIDPEKFKMVAVAPEYVTCKHCLKKLSVHVSWG